MAFMSFEIKTVKKIVFLFFFCFSFKNNRRTNVILIRTKNALFRGSKMVLFKNQISKYFCVCASCRFSQKNINILASWNFLKIKKLWRTGRAPGNFGIGLLKLYLTFGYLTCSVQSKQNFHTPPYPAGALTTLQVH